MDSWINDTDDLLDLPPLVPIRNISSINTPSSPSCGEDYIICDKSTSCTSDLGKNIRQRHSKIDYQLPEDISWLSDTSSSSEDDSGTYLADDLDDESTDELEEIPEHPKSKTQEVKSVRPSLKYDPRIPISQEWICCPFCDYKSHRPDFFKIHFKVQHSEDTEPDPPAKRDSDSDSAYSSSATKRRRTSSESSDDVARHKLIKLHKDIEPVIEFNSSNTKIQRRTTMAQSPNLVCHIFPQSINKPEDKQTTFCASQEKGGSTVEVISCPICDWQMKDLGKYGNTFANHLDLHRLQPDLMKWQLDIQPCKQCHYAALSHRTLARHTRKYH